MGLFVLDFIEIGNTILLGSFTKRGGNLWNPV